MSEYLLFPTRLISRAFSNTLFSVKNSPSHDDLAIFLTVVREGGFRAASRRLGLAPSKVSTTVSRIEADLGVPLLIRTTRSLRTTEAGQALAERIAPHLAGLDADSSSMKIVPRWERLEIDCLVEGECFVTDVYTCRVGEILQVLD